MELVLISVMEVEKWKTKSAKWQQTQFAFAISRFSFSIA